MACKPYSKTPNRAEERLREFDPFVGSSLLSDSGRRGGLGKVFLQSRLCRPKEFTLCEAWRQGCFAPPFQAAKRLCKGPNSAMPYANLMRRFSENPFPGWNHGRVPDHGIHNEKAPIPH